MIFPSICLYLSISLSFSHIAKFNSVWPIFYFTLSLSFHFNLNIFFCWNKKQHILSFHMFIYVCTVCDAIREIVKWKTRIISFYFCNIDKKSLSFHLIDSNHSQHLCLHMYVCVYISVSSKQIWGWFKVVVANSISNYLLFY